MSESFWSRVQKTDTCWLWTSYKNEKGYGVFRPRHTGNVLTHRAAWQLVNGPIPDGTCVLHRCDNPACVRPDHLFLGTRADNNRDMVRKGRNAIWNVGLSHCKRGHEFTEANTYRWQRTGRRQGRSCRLLSYHRNKAGAA